MVSRCAKTVVFTVNYPYFLRPKTRLVNWYFGSNGAPASSRLWVQSRIERFEEPRASKAGWKPALRPVRYCTPTR